jgi:hypothetical protein
MDTKLAQRHLFRQRTANQIRCHPRQKRLLAMR